MTFSGSRRDRRRRERIFSRPNVICRNVDDYKSGIVFQRVGDDKEKMGNLKTGGIAIVKASPSFITAA